MKFSPKIRVYLNARLIDDAVAAVNPMAGGGYIVAVTSASTVRACRGWQEGVWILDDSAALAGLPRETLPE